MAFLSMPLSADELSAADDALSEILWDYEDSFEFVQYRINDSGFVDMTFASNIPDDMYIEIITRADKHPDIDGVIAGKGGAVCNLFPH